MSSELLVERRTPLTVSPEAAFAWHARPGALERLTPPWIRLCVLERSELANGQRTRLSLQLGPLLFQWISEYREVEPGRGFSDVQVQGPFDSWVHQHRFEPASDGGAVLHDRIRCELPGWARPGRSRIRKQLERMLTYRHAVTAAD